VAAVRRAWLRTVSDDDIDAAAAVQEFLRDGGAVSVEDRHLMDRLADDYAAYQAGE
jgi:hypothetical protein